MSNKRDFDSLDSESETSEKRAKKTHSLSLPTENLSSAQLSRIIEYNAANCDERNTLFTVVPIRDADYEIVLAMFAASKQQPTAWPKVLGFGSSMHFDVGDAFATCRKKVAEKSFTEVGYMKFFGTSSIYTQSTNVSCAEAVLGPNPYPKARCFESALINFRQCARIVREYIQREETFNDSRIVPMSFFSRSLLLEPFSMYRDQFGRLYHIPMIRGTAWHQDFLPDFVERIVSVRDRFRVAQFISLVRLCYSMTFGRSFDEDFESELRSPTHAAFCLALKAERFPIVDWCGLPASVMLIEWMLRCLKNTINAEEIDSHAVFIAEGSNVWKSTITCKEPLYKHQYKTLSGIVFSSIRLTDDIFEINVNSAGPTTLEENHMLMKKSCVTPRSAEEEANLNFSLTVFAEVLKMLRQKREYRNGMLLKFSYSNHKASGNGVSREIVFRCFEGIKHWAGFEYDEKCDTLELGGECAASLIPIDLKLEFIMVLLYWVTTNNEVLPFMLSPSLLCILFNIRARHSLSSLFNNARLLKTSAVNCALDCDEKTDDFFETYAVRDRMALLDDIATRSINKQFPYTNNCIVTFTNPVLNNYQSIVNSIYDDASGVCYAFSQRTYDVNQSRKLSITNQLAVMLLNFGSFNPADDVDVDDSFLENTVVSIDSSFKPQEQKLLHYLTYYTNQNTSLTPSPEVVRILSAARRQTYCFFIRWLLSATEQQLAYIWKNLHGITKLIPIRYDVEAFKLPANISALAVYATVPPSDSINPFRALVATAKHRKIFCSAMYKKHAALFQHINVDFRIPRKENELQLAPQFFTCTNSIVLSMCHDSYESFADTMNNSCADEKVIFTADT